MKSFFSEKRGQKLGCLLYTGAHYTRVNTVYSNQPGSIGHSFKDANSAGLLPVNTQLELRSIIGILKIDKNKHILAKMISYGTYTRK